MHAVERNKHYLRECLVSTPVRDHQTTCFGTCPFRNADESSAAPAIMTCPFNSHMWLPNLRSELTLLGSYAAVFVSLEYVVTHEQQLTTD